MKTAIIGLGNIGARLARNLTAGGERIIVAAKTLEAAEKVAHQLGSRAEAMTVEEAIEKADVIILAIYFDAIKQFLTAHRDALAGKIIVDPSNPIAPDGKGGFRKTIPDKQSSGQLISGLLPDRARLVKAFGTLGAGSLEAAANRSPERAVLFYAADDPEAGNIVARLISASGFAPIRVGGIDQSLRIEVGGDLHEFGKLGKLVSVEEAESLV
ncbi:NADPH-dependent F420 reductase [Paraburkholderia pallida]|uniref:NADP oxidoreductase coenzyme F420-dependent n=1 Tax=Paraburkholderia pallida TaxID=2547399 RepID=A0A4P7D7W9_9BURK|nr:NAD(P)-binding domain-containing protein [Paraburkholderia pallida]QBR04288.1 NADP oxidoreductase coenzyme F420-dependent [Paraburkholderia pallida]